MITIMNRTPQEREQARSALAFIVPVLEKYRFEWVITGGFACYAYGVDRLLTDIDIDINTSKESKEFKALLAELGPHITQPLENFVDENYNNFNFELTIKGQVIDICPMDELLIYNKGTGSYESFYRHPFPEVELVAFEGFCLPLLTKQAILDNKEMLTQKDKWQQRDIDALRRLLKA